MYLITISGKNRKLTERIALPASKSISNRLLILRALSKADIHLESLSAAEDTLLLRELLNQAGIARRPASGHQVAPGQDLPAEPERSACKLDCRNAGTVLRFLTACLAIQPGTWILSGSDRMHHRPVGILVEALRSFGASIGYMGEEGYPPLQIEGKALRGGEVTVDGSVSSQFISALLMIGPELPGGLTLRITGTRVSSPYVEMTLRIMEQLGATVEREKEILRVLPGKYHAGLLPGHRYMVEADWSSAAFWYEAAALAGESEIRLPGLYQQSLQGDAVVADLFRPLDVETTYDADGIVIRSHEARGKRQEERDHSSPVRLSARPLVRLSPCPDLAPALIVTYAALGIPARFTGIEHLAVKESDRLNALAQELKKLGRTILTPASGIVETIAADPLPPFRPDETPACIETYEDHRIAMAFAPLALNTGGIRISDPSVVSKSYPGFWEEMKKLGFSIFEE
ncbi:MAG: 3-phosphoshikimate 1-carboxyvinyltransferase [Bacteroidales bacterium]|nr:3-phosphoshikimate 1-carboxyvinyltransferase [Bacteroidales bacterium]